MTLARRAFLQRTALAMSGAGLAGMSAMLGAGCGRTSSGRARKKKTNGSGDEGGASATPTVAMAVAELRAATASDALQRIQKLMGRGLSHDQLRAALVTHWAGVDGDVHGGLALHAILAIERELAPRERLLALFRAVDLTVAHRLAWKSMPPRKPVPGAMLGLSLSDLSARTRIAFDGLKSDEVRLCVRALHQRWGQEAVSAELLRMAARDDGFGGHSAHLVVASLDMLRTVKWHAADAVLDQVAARLQPPGTGQAPPSKAAMAAFARQQKLVTRAGERWQKGVRQMNESRALRKMARMARGDALEAAVRDALDRGVHPDALWDGLSLAAADMTLVDPSPSGTGVHALLLMSALRQAARRAPTPQARLITLLGAAWRLPSHRPGGRATPVPTSVTGTEVQRFRISDARKRRADAIRLAAGNGGAKALAVRDGLRDVTLRKATTDLHQLEVPVATTRLAAVAAPHFQGEILAASATCTPDPSGPDWARLAEAERLIAALRAQ